MADEKIDFAELDPARDPERWEQLMAAVTQRALDARVRPNPLLLQLVTWARPAVALAAGLAVAIWCGALALGGRSTERALVSAEDPVHALTSWAAEDAIPAAIDPVDVLGGIDGH